MKSIVTDKRIIRILAIIIAFVMIFWTCPGSTGAYAASESDIDAAFVKTADYIYGTLNDDPTQDNIWALYGLSIAGYPLSDNILEKFRTNVESYVKSKDGKLTIVKRDRGGVITETDTGQYTEYSKLVLIYNELGLDPTNVAGYNLVDPLSDTSKIYKQGINGPIWALMALDGCGFAFSEKAKADAGNSITTRDKLIGRLLKGQLSDGGWAFMGTKADPDITGMAVRALAPHYNDSDEIHAALDKAVECMSKMQLNTGDFATIMEEGASATPTSESASQIICGASLLGIDINADARFIKNGNSAMDALLSYYVPKTGGFKHISSNKKLNGLATEQGFYALAHYYRYVLHRYYDMSEDNIRKQEEKDKAKAEILNGGSSGSEGTDPGTNNDPNEGTEVVNGDPAADGQKTGTSEAEEVNNEENPSQDTEENVSGKVEEKSDENEEAIDKTEEKTDDEEASEEKSDKDKKDKDKKDKDKKIKAGGVTYGGGQKIISDKVKKNTNKGKTVKDQEKKTKEPEKKKEDKDKAEEEKDKKDEEEKDKDKDKDKEDLSDEQPEEVQTDSTLISSSETPSIDSAADQPANEKGLPVKTIVLAAVLAVWLLLGLIYLVKTRKRSV